MADTVLTGRILFPDGVSEGTIGISDGRIEYFDQGEVLKDSKVKPVCGLISPGLIDAHTHLGDHGARGRLPFTLEEVMFPGGLKHRFLGRASELELIASIRSSLVELAPGVTRTLDFREGGVKGIRYLKEALSDETPRVHGFGRPFKEESIDDIIRISDGLGIPSISGASREVRQRCRKLEKPYSIHASELFREDIGIIMDLEPDLLVHMVSGHVEDWQMVAEKGIPVAVCPRSNLAYSIDAPMSEMIEQGLLLGLGTDNSVSVKQDMWREMEYAWMLLRSQGSGIDDISMKVFEIAVGSDLMKSGSKNTVPRLVDWKSKDWLRKGTEADLMVIDLANRTKDPMEQLVRFCGQKDVLWTSTPGIKPR